SSSSSSSSSSNDDTDDPSNWGRQLALEAHQRDYAIDAACDGRFAFTHHAVLRQLQLDGLCNSSHYPLQYAVRLAPAAVGPNRDAAAFAQRGMCVARPGNVSVLAISPRGVVRAAAAGAIPFCDATFVFSRHPRLHTAYRFDFTWACGEDGDAAMAVVKRTPTLSELRHTGATNETRCTLTVRNTLTKTQRSDTFLLRRVYPTAVSPAFVVLSDNAAVGNCVTNATAGGRRTAEATTTTTTNGGGGDQGPRRRPATRWVVGKSVVLHVDASAEGAAVTDVRNAYWRALSVVTAEPSSIGTQLLLDSIHFLPLAQHPRALARGTGGVTAMVTGIRVPGLYTIALYHPDPAHPYICPNVSVVETLHVTHARVIEKELTVCGDSVVLKAVPIPREIECQFVGQWEMVSLQTADNETWTAGANFSGVRFDHGTRPRTLVHGLPFGIVTIRWAIYAASPLDNTTDGAEQLRQHGRRVLV
ncbi:hypothetical protein DQ04_20541000, partial [Trypanosoma grayi]|uniref:hypothetical protein n=1 Tax=Trypanosoma grayi TaxID=71804 RepID=UPI0004F45DDB